MAESHAALSKPPRIKPNETGPSGNRLTIKQLVREQLEQDELLESLVDEPYTMEDGSDGPGFTDLQEHYSSLLSKPQADVKWALEALRKDVQDSTNVDGDEKPSTKPRATRKPQPRPKLPTPATKPAVDEKKKSFDRVKSSPLLPAGEPPKPLRRSTHSAGSLASTDLALRDRPKGPPKPQRRSMYGAQTPSMTDLSEEPKAPASHPSQPQPTVQQRSLTHPPQNTSDQKPTIRQSAVQQQGLPPTPTVPSNHKPQPAMQQRRLPAPPPNTADSTKKEEPVDTGGSCSNEAEYADVNFTANTTTAAVPQSNDVSQQPHDEKKKKTSTLRHSLGGKLGKLKVKGNTINVDVTDEGQSEAPTKPTVAPSASRDWSASDITLKPEDLIQIMQLVKEGKCTQEEAVARVKEKQMQEAAQAASQQENEERNGAPSSATQDESVDTGPGEEKTSSATASPPQANEDPLYADVSPVDKQSAEDMNAKRTRTMTLKGKLSGLLAHRKNADEGAEGDEAVDSKATKKTKKGSKLGFFNKKGEKDAAKDEDGGAVCEYVDDANATDGSKNHAASSGSLSGVSTDTPATSESSATVTMHVPASKGLAGLRNVLARRNMPKDDDTATEDSAVEKKQRPRSRSSDSAPKSSNYVAKAVVEMPYNPSPYDKSALSLEVGDVINVISMPDHGTWTGELNGKVGSFKFIYITLLDPEEEKERSRSGSELRQSPIPPAPNSIKDMLEQLLLPAEYNDLFIANGYDDITFIKDIDDVSALDQIGIKNAAHQEAILFMVDVLNAEDGARHFSLSKRSSRQIPLTPKPTQQNVSEEKPQPTPPKQGGEKDSISSPKKQPISTDVRSPVRPAPVAARRATVGAQWKESQEKAATAKATHRLGTRVFNESDIAGKVPVLPILPKGNVGFQLSGLGKPSEEDKTKPAEKPLNPSVSLKVGARNTPEPGHRPKSPEQKNELPAMEKEEHSFIGKQDLSSSEKKGSSTDGVDEKPKQQAPGKTSSGKEKKKGSASSGDAVASVGQSSTALPMRGVLAPPPPPGRAKSEPEDKETKARKRQAPPPPTAGPLVKESKSPDGDCESKESVQKMPSRGKTPLPDDKLPTKDTLESNNLEKEPKASSKANVDEVAPAVVEARQRSSSKPEDPKGAPPKPERRATAPVKTDRLTPTKPVRTSGDLPTAQSTRTTPAKPHLPTSPPERTTRQAEVKATNEAMSSDITTPAEELSSASKQEDLDITDGPENATEVPKKSPRVLRRVEAGTKSPASAAKPKPASKPPVAAKSHTTSVKTADHQETSNQTVVNPPDSDTKCKSTVQAKIVQDKIKLTAAPYSGRDGRGAVPLGLVQRYAIECRLPAKQVATSLEQLRQEALTQANRPVVPTEPCNTDLDWKDTVKKTTLSAWLISIGLPMFSDTLMDNGYEIDSISELSMDELHSFGITDPRHVKRLLDCANL